MNLRNRQKYISTHILTKRMTAPIEAAIKDLKYFNSHPHEEDDAAMKEATYFTCIFQLTSSRRGWLFHIHLSCSSISISTHILTKRMTLRTLMLPILRVYFNSHPHEEDDGLCFPLGLLNWYFNSHPHEEDDLRNDGTANRSDISTHILTKRMTRTKPCRIPRH